MESLIKQIQDLERKLQSSQLERNAAADRAAGLETELRGYRERLTAQEAKELIWLREKSGFDVEKHSLLQQIDALRSDNEQRVKATMSLEKDLSATRTAQVEQQRKFTVDVKKLADLVLTLQERAAAAGANRDGGAAAMAVETSANKAAGETVTIVEVEQMKQEWAEKTQVYDHLFARVKLQKTFAETHYGAAVEACAHCTGACAALLLSMEGAALPSVLGSLEEAAEGELAAAQKAGKGYMDSLLEQGGVRAPFTSSDAQQALQQLPAAHQDDMSFAATAQRTLSVTPEAIEHRLKMSQEALVQLDSGGGKGSPSPRLRSPTKLSASGVMSISGMSGTDGAGGQISGAMHQDGSSAAFAASPAIAINQDGSIGDLVNQDASLCSLSPVLNSSEGQMLLQTQGLGGALRAASGSPVTGGAAADTSVDFDEHDSSSSSGGRGGAGQVEGEGEGSGEEHMPVEGGEGEGEGESA